MARLPSATLGEPWPNGHVLCNNSGLNAQQLLKGFPSPLSPVFQCCLWHHYFSAPSLCTPRSTLSQQEWDKNGRVPVVFRLERACICTLAGSSPFWGHWERALQPVSIFHTTFLNRVTAVALLPGGDDKLKMYLLTLHPLSSPVGLGGHRCELSVVSCDLREQLYACIVSGQ